MTLSGRTEFDQEVREVVLDILKQEPPISLGEPPQRIKNEQRLVRCALIAPIPNSKIAEAVPNGLARRRRILHQALRLCTAYEKRVGSVKSIAVEVGEGQHFEGWKKGQLAAPPPTPPLRAHQRPRPRSPSDPLRSVPAGSELGSAGHDDTGP